MIFETIIVGPFMMNCYILGCEKSHKAVVIDPGDEPDNILEKLKELGLSLEYILLTHAHIDHIGAVAELVQQTGAKILMHKNDDFLRLNAGAQAKMFNLPVPGKFTVDQYITDDQIIDLGPYQIKVIHTPGHSPGCVCYLVENLLVSGDTLFYESIGRTDLFSGSFSDISLSIQNKLFVLDKNINVYPGHGPSTSIEHEMNNNPYVK